ncbi:hypothetical protein Nepgr_032169 [Nepenthes gracilis]|uniref:Uncharacterized protein n=1 Tax=Nepenthes gracilis TaxID=150966 RepID=A0AAD3TJI2_NEPGR|nr:hypothetical protein Nepgr_032169 [Nepenthes gracilis]
MELKPWIDKRERKMHEKFANLYAITKASEKLEKVYIRGMISTSERESDCQKLTAQFKTLSTTSNYKLPGIEQLVVTYMIDCPAEMDRLPVSGVPSTVKHRAAAPTAATTSAAIVAEAVQNFITDIDSLKLIMVAVDKVYPLLSDLSTSLNRMSILPTEFKRKTEMKE